MNKSTFLTTALCTAVMLTSCRTKTQAADSSASLSGDNITIISHGSRGSSDDGRYENHTLNLGSFTAISVNTAAKITWHQGRTHKVTVRTTSRLWDKMSFKVTDGTFTVGAKRDYESFCTGKDSVCIDITCPSLKSLKCNGSMTFRTSEMKADGLSVHNNGSMRLFFGNLRCGDFNVQNNGALTICGDVEARNVDLRNNGSMKVADRYTASGAMSVHNHGANTMDCDIKTPSLSLICQGSDKYILNVKGDSMYADINGAGNLKGSFSGSELSVNGSGLAKIDLDIDCRNLKVRSNGKAEVTLRGTADDTDIESSGIATVNTTSLNKF